MYVSLERLVEGGFFETRYGAVDCVRLAPGFGAVVATGAGLMGGPVFQPGLQGADVCSERFTLGGVPVIQEFQSLLICLYERYNIVSPKFGSCLYSRASEE